jgi:hypothetical protein
MKDFRPRQWMQPAPADYVVPRYQYRSDGELEELTLAAIKPMIARLGGSVKRTDYVPESEGATMMQLLLPFNEINSVEGAVGKVPSIIVRKVQTPLTDSTVARNSIARAIKIMQDLQAVQRGAPLVAKEAGAGTVLKLQGGNK